MKHFLLLIVFSILVKGSVIVNDAGSNTPGRNACRERNKRDAETRSCDEKFRRIGNHTACRTPSAKSKPIEVSQGDKDIIVNTHNMYRGSVTPTATNMLQVSWDEEIAMIAQRWAETCENTHDESRNRDIPGRFSLGQNLGQGYETWSAVISAWFGEVINFRFGIPGDFHIFGHYTQGVWADTSKIGCGLANCDGTIFHVCNYGPAGNVGEVEKPYKSGPTCAECPTNCQNNLCECRDAACENGGVMNRSTCICSCKHLWHVGNQCHLNCEAVGTELDYCGSPPFDRDGCATYGNVPDECPFTCEICQNAGSDPSRSMVRLVLMSNSAAVAVCRILTLAVALCCCCCCSCCCCKL